MMATPLMPCISQEVLLVMTILKWPWQLPCQLHCACVIESDIRCKSSQQHASGKGHTHVLTNTDNSTTTHQNKV